MSSVFSLPPLLFVTFREMYHISYTLLGSLVLVNFCTQLVIDLIFSFFAKYFNIHKTVKIMPLLTTLGLLIYAIIPTLLPQHTYLGLLIGTVIFSVAGLSEVLLSSLIAATPSKHPEKNMSLLHSLYAWGVFGMALFAILLGSVRTWYAKYGRNISQFLLCSMIGATACYFIIGVSGNIILSFLTCVLTGCFTSMLWPGTLILMEEKMPNPGVAAYALMAAGGDFGASIAPQLWGVIVDTVTTSSRAAQLSTTVSLSTEQIGMKVGMLSASLFPLLGTFLLIYIRKSFAK